MSSKGTFGFWNDGPRNRVRFSGVLTPRTRPLLSCRSSRPCRPRPQSTTSRSRRNNTTGHHTTKCRTWTFYGFSHEFRGFFRQHVNGSPTGRWREPESVCRSRQRSRARATAVKALRRLRAVLTVRPPGCRNAIGPEVFAHIELSQRQWHHPTTRKRRNMERLTLEFTVHTGNVVVPDGGRRWLLGECLPTSGRSTVVCVMRTTRGGGNSAAHRFQSVQFDPIEFESMIFSLPIRTVEPSYCFSVFCITRIMLHDNVYSERTRKIERARPNTECKIH